MGFYNCCVVQFQTDKLKIFLVFCVLQFILSSEYLLSLNYSVFSSSVAVQCLEIFDHPTAVP